MRKTFYLFFIALALAPVSALSLSKNLERQISVLMDKGYEFYAHKKDKIIYFSNQGRHVKISYEEFLKKKHFSAPSVALNKKRKLEVINVFLNDEFRLIVVKDGRYFSLDSETGKFSRIFPEKNPNNYYILTKEQVISSELLDASKCAYCMGHLSYKAMFIEEEGQFSSEIGWLPYYAINSNFGIRLFTGLSTYLLEKDNGQKVQSPGLQYQLLFKFSFWHLFLEAGAGTRYLAHDNAYAFMNTVGAGYVFQRSHWVFTKDVKFSNIFLHLSSVNWLKPTKELKLGVGFAF